MKVSSIEVNPSKRAKKEDTVVNKVEVVDNHILVNNRQVKIGDMMEALYDDKKWYPGKVIDMTNCRVKLYFEDDKTTHSYSSNIRFID